MLKLRLTKQARRFFDTLPAKQYRQVLNKVLALMDHPEPPDSIQMKGYVYRRADVGEYRIVYHVENDCLNVVAYVGKRNDDDDVYRHLK